MIAPPSTGSKILVRNDVYLSMSYKSSESSEEYGGFRSSYAVWNFSPRIARMAGYRA